MAAKLKMFKETTLPVTLEANSFYLIAPPGFPNHFEMYLTGTSNTVIKRIINRVDIQAMIDAAIALDDAMEMVADIAERNTLAPNKNVIVLVLDATGDTTVASGAATYAFRHSTSTWTKISEAESLDVIVNWSMIQNKPTSAVADIDNAVTVRHSHSNKAVLDLLAVNSDGKLTYNGKVNLGWGDSRWHYNDFDNVDTGSCAPFTATAMSGGDFNSAPLTANSNAQGVLVLRKANTANGGARLQTTQPIISEEDLTFRAVFLLVGTLATRVVRVGYLDSISSADAVDGSYFEINGSTVVAKTSSDSTRTSAGSAVLTADTFYVFDIEYITDTSVRFVVCNLITGAVMLDQTISTNVPPGNISRSFMAGLLAHGSATGAADLCHVDYMGFGTTKPPFITIPFTV